VEKTKTVGFTLIQWSIGRLLDSIHLVKYFIIFLCQIYVDCVYRFSLSKIFGMVSGVFSVVVLVWLDVKDGRGGVTGGGEIYHN
jgi:hypothetical protein